MHGVVRDMNFLCLAEMHPRLMALGKATKEELSEFPEVQHVLELDCK